MELKCLKGGESVLFFDCVKTINSTQPESNMIKFSFCVGISGSKVRPITLRALYALVWCAGNPHDVY